MELSISASNITQHAVQLLSATSIFINFHRLLQTKHSTNTQKAALPFGETIPRIRDGTHVITAHVTGLRGWTDN